MIRVTAFAVSVLVLAGCGGGPSTGTVNGTVMLDGQPLKQGTVKFVPTDAKLAPAGAEVKDGKFTAVVPVGESKVEFSASKVIGKKKMYDTPDSPFVEETAESLPAKYNVKTELKYTVKSGSQDEKFELASK